MGLQGQRGGQLHGAEGGAGLDRTPDWGRWSGLGVLTLGQHGRHAHIGVHQLTQVRSYEEERRGRGSGRGRGSDQLGPLRVVVN